MSNPLSSGVKLTVLVFPGSKASHGQGSSLLYSVNGTEVGGRRLELPENEGFKLVCDHTSHFLL